jgi:CSLREA domain-containing protein
VSGARQADDDAAIQATFVVTKTADTRDGSCDANDCSLREAVIDANADPGDDIITLPAGTYLLTLGGSENAAAAGDLDITRGSITINGAGQGSTIVDAGQLSPRDRVFQVFGGAGLTLNGVTIRNGSAALGGGISNDGGTVTIQNSVVTANTSQQDGGGINSTGSLTIRNSTISRNTSGEDGGGIRVGGSGARLDLDGVTIDSNTTANGGGGIGVETSDPASFATIVIANSAVTNNIGTHPNLDGGGINFDGGIATVTNTRITGNRNGRGGGMQATDGANVTMDRVVISGNTAPHDGGGIQFGQGTLTMTNSEVTNNSTDEDGGGLELGGAGSRGSGLTANLTNVTISGNSAVAGGGVSAGANGPTTVNLTNVTVADNSAGAGSNMRIDDDGPGTIGVFNSVVANGRNSDNCNVVPNGSIQSRGNNIDSGSSCGFTSSGDQQSTNPGLQPLANNGGPTRTHALASGSPAIDRGNNNGCPSTDQRGAARPADGSSGGSAVCDVGAFEVGPAAPPPTATPTPTSLPTATPTPRPTCNPRPTVSIQTSNAGGGRLRVIVTANTGPGAPNNTIHAIRFEAGTNALVSVNGQAARGGPFTATFSNARTVELFISRQGNGGAATQPFVVTHDCGEWRSFAGGGPNAF